MSGANHGLILCEKITKKISIEKVKLSQAERKGLDSYRNVATDIAGLKQGIKMLEWAYDMVKNNAQVSMFDEMGK